MKAFVLCAGLGTRLGQLTRTLPKPMLPIQGRPLLEYTVAHLSQHGYRDIVVNLHFMPEIITEHFGNGARWDVSLVYSYEPQLLGTAGALKRMEPFLRGDDPFLVHYGDVITDQDLTAMLAFHREKQAAITMLVHQRTGSNSVATMEESGRVVSFLERPSEEERRNVSSSWVNSGVFLFSPNVLAAIPAGRQCDIPRDVLPVLILAGNVYGFPLTGYRCAVDSPQRLAEAQAAVAEGRCIISFDGKSVP